MATDRIKPNPVSPVVDQPARDKNIEQDTRLTSLEGHQANSANPHSVTAEQTGAIPAFRGIYTTGDILDCPWITDGLGGIINVHPDVTGMPGEGYANLWWQVEVYQLAVGTPNYKMVATAASDPRIKSEGVMVNGVFQGWVDSANSGYLAPDKLTDTTDLPSGIYSTNDGSILGLPCTSSSWYHIVHCKHHHLNGYANQIATNFNSGAMYVRAAQGTSWGAWKTIYDSTREKLKRIWSGTGTGGTYTLASGEKFSNWDMVAFVRVDATGATDAAMFQWVPVMFFGHTDNRIHFPDTEEQGFVTYTNDTQFNWNRNGSTNDAMIAVYGMRL